MKKKNIKLLILFCLLLISTFVLTQTVLAWDKSASQYLDKIATHKDIDIKTNVTMAVMVGRIINGILGFLGILFLVIILYAGFTWTNAGGSEEDVTQARNLIKWSIIGIIVIIGAYAISFYVVDQINKNLIKATAPEPKVSEDQLNPIDPK